jgi:copper(I)-binding protein
VNDDSVDVTIASVTSPVSASAALHETMLHEGMAHMVPRPAIVVARDSTLVLAPGGLHVMLNDLTRALHAGDSVRLTLTLGDGRSIPVTAAIRAP